MNGLVNLADKQENLGERCVNNQSPDRILFSLTLAEI